MEKMLTLEKFEEASEVVRKVTLETKLVYSDYDESSSKKSNNAKEKIIAPVSVNSIRKHLKMH